MFFEKVISYYNPNTPDKNCKIKFLIENPGFNGFLEIICAQIQLSITFCSDFMCNKTLKAKNSTPKYTNF